MGNTKSCEFIKPRIDRACDIGKCTKSIKGYASNSASPSDIWELEMYESVMYGNEKIPNTLILKLYIDSPSEDLIRRIERPVANSNQLIYESDIYNYVIGLFTRENINPYFVRYYGASQNCTFDQLVESVTTGNSQEMMTKLGITREQFINNLINNTVFMLFNLRGRPSISDPNFRGNPQQREMILNVLNGNPQDKIKYGMIITEKSNGVVFDEWFDSQIEDGKINHDGWKSIVQVLSALTALETLGVAHNDLHHGNIFVEELNEEVSEQFKYNVDEDDELEFIINSKFRCAIYDWDRGYMEKLRDNPVLVRRPNLCRISSQCNEYVPQRDLTKFLIYILKKNNLNDIEKEKIYSCMMENNSNKVNYFKTNVLVSDRTAHRLYINKEGRSVTRKDLEDLGIFTPNKVLTNLLSLLETEDIIQIINSDSMVGVTNFIYDMTIGTVQQKFIKYYDKKDFKQIERIFQDDISLTGSNEDISSRDFLERMELKKSIDYSHCGQGPNPAFDYQWAEYKTSLLCKEISVNPISVFDQELFLQKMIINIVTPLNIDLNEILTLYNNQLLNDEQLGETRAYPVAQSQVWRNNPRGLWKDMYGLINFIKWLWLQLKRRTFYDNTNCNKQSLVYYLLIMTMQQACMKIQKNIRGPRIDEMAVVAKEKDIMVGISDISDNILNRTISDNPNIPVKSWIHPGKSKCFVPFYGGYGAEIKKYRDNPDNNIYSSLKCGISGSVNFFIFLYLLSTMVSEDKEAPLNSKRLMILLISVLAGDGGHNIREIMFGTATTVIILKNLLDDIKIDLRNQLNNEDISFKEAVKRISDAQNFDWVQEGTIIYRLISKLEHFMRNTNCKNNELIMLVLKCLVKWESPVNEIYNITSSMNIVGIDAQEIENLGNTRIIDLNYLKSEVYDIFFSDTDEVLSVHLTNSVQLFYALENDRYLMDKNESFKRNPDEMIINILESLYPGIYKNVNDYLINKLITCYPNINLQKHIPFA